MNRMLVALFTKKETAAPIQRRLAEAGFAAQVRAASALAGMWFVKPSTVSPIEVPAGQFERAENFLLDLDKRENALKDAIRCPECGSLRVDFPQFARRSLMTNLALGAAAALGIIEKNFFCHDCQYTWPREGMRFPRRREHGAPYYFIEGINQTGANKPSPTQRS